MKKYLMLVATKAQLLQAFHIKQKMLGYCHADIVIIGKQFDADYTTRLNRFFDHAWFVANEYFSQKEFIRFMSSPEKALKYKIRDEMELDYTDIFCWNPDYLFYYIRKYEKKKHIKYKWHMLQDAEGNYCISAPLLSVDFPQRNFIERWYYRYETSCKRIFPVNCDDEFIWKPELRVTHYLHDEVICPPISRDESDYISAINYIFGYNPEPIAEKYIFIDTYPGYFDYYTFPVIKGLSDLFGRDNLAVCMHPGVDKSEYGELSEHANFIKNKAPWEVLCINGITKNKKIIGVMTSALVMGYAVCDDDSDVYCLSECVSREKLGDWISEEWLAIWKELYRNAALSNEHFHIIEKIEDIVAD